MVAHDEIPELTTDNCIFVNLKNGQLIAMSIYQIEKKQIMNLFY